MKEYIVMTDEEELYYNSFDYKEFIRCEDCIHHHGYSCDRLYGLQDAFTLQDDDYCSRAERKETEA